MKAEVVVDLQFGSTAKGKVCAYLARVFHYDYSVRVQSIQAGHTIYNNGIQYKMRTIPCAWVNSNVKLVLGPGCFIDKDLLLKEINMIEADGYSIKHRLYLDYRATYITKNDIKVESDLQLTKKMGSTAEGAGSSLIRKLWRKDTPTRVIDDRWASMNDIKVVDTIEMLNHGNPRVLVEGCQGTLLSVHTSPYYPFCTSRECTVAGIISEAGIAPSDVVKVHGVFRTYPIRVGGNSGPTGAKEVTWDYIRESSGNRDLVPEKTTVTNRERRIFEFSDEDFKLALRLNKPDKFYLAFIDYVNFKDYGKYDFEDLTDYSKDWVSNLERRHNIKINWISTGEQPEHIIRR